MPNQSWDNGRGEKPFGAKAPRSKGAPRSPSSSGPAAPSKGADKAFKEAAKSAIEANSRVNEFNQALKGTGSTSAVAASEVTSLAKGLKLNASASQMAAVASEQSALSANLQADALGLLVSLAWEAAKAVVAMGAAFTKATLDAVDFREGTIAAIDSITKKKGEGSKAFEIGIELAARFHLDPQQTIASLHGLISKGFTSERAKIVMEAMADLKVLSPKANLDKVSLAIEQIQGKGKLQMEELQGQLAEAGLSVSMVLDQLAAKYGKSTDEVRKMISKGKVNAEEGIDAIVAAIQKMGSGKLGDAAEKAARSTVSGLVAGIKMRLGVVPLEMAKMLAGSAGVGAVKGALGNLLDALNPSKTKEMKDMVGALSVFASTLFSVLFGGAASKDAGKTLKTVLAGITTGIQMASTAIKVVGPVFSEFFGGMGGAFMESFSLLKEMGDGLLEAFGGDKAQLVDDITQMARSFGKVLGYLVVAAALTAAALVAVLAAGTSMAAAIQSGFWLVVAAVDRVVSRVQEFKSQVQSLPGEMSAIGSSMGSNLWSGFVGGILAGVAAVTEAGSLLANAAKSAVSTTLDIHSPSRVLAELGGHTAAGFAQGVDGGAGQVDAAMNALVTPSLPPGSPAAGGAGGAGAGVVITIGDIHVHAPGSSAADAGAIGRSVRRELEAFFEDALAQAGLSPVPT